MALSHGPLLVIQTRLVRWARCHVVGIDLVGFGTIDGLGFTRPQRDHPVDIQLDPALLRVGDGEFNGTNLELVAAVAMLAQQPGAVSLPDDQVNEVQA